MQSRPYANAAVSRGHASLRSLPVPAGVKKTELGLPSYLHFYCRRCPLLLTLISSARRMLQAALEREADDYVKAHAHLRNEHGHRIVKRNGHQPEREILTGAGPLAIQRPHIRDPRVGHTFTSAILPRYMRRSPSLADRRSADALIPALYLRGVSTNDFPLALQAILGL